jgi:uncharacterized BrkB/YihY/UPF0761 family membrane protein
VLQLLFHNNEQLKADVAEKISSYFPLLGDQLQASIGSTGKTGLGLAIGILITIYGARGAADALRFAQDTMWNVPKVRRSGFPKALLQSFSIMGLGALGFLVTVAVSSLVSGLGHGWWVGLGLNLIGWGIATVVLAAVFRVATAHPVPLKAMLPGAAIAAAVIQLLLTFGGLLVASQLKHFDSLYGTFAVVLGLLFWIYLMAQIIIYSAEINVVRHEKLWPRALDAANPAEADKRAYDRYAKSEKRIPPEKVKTRFERT